MQRARMSSPAPGYVVRYDVYDAIIVLNNPEEGALKLIMHKVLRLRPVSIIVLVNSTDTEDAPTQRTVRRIQDMAHGKARVHIASRAEDGQFHVAHLGIKVVMKGRNAIVYT